MSRMTAHQQVLLELLRTFDAICRKHGIRYQLFAGTALGAARHGGFIPWDDDVDVVMARSEYQRFLEAAPRELDPERCFLQAEFSPHWPMFYTKLRMQNTTCLERFVPKDMRMHQGIYIDIFPYDALADGALTRKLQFLASKVVIAKCLYRRGYRTDSPKKKAAMQLCRLLPLQPFLRFVRRQGKPGKDVHTFFAAASRYEMNVFPALWLEESILLIFEGEAFPVSAYYDALLTRLYGDWRALPPEAERQAKQHAVLVDAEHAYERYLAAQKEMEFDGYGRSMR